VIGILGEYDALGGLSQAVSAAKEVLAAEGKSGTVRYYGCPAEE
jgi:metal-dependent amidase/aminoacylase/carboxypeptidase family protein